MFYDALMSTVTPIRPMSMRAAMFYGAGDVRMEEIAVPKVAPGEVLIRVRAALTCGSDLKAYRQGHPVLLGDNYPAPFGHEVSGTIAEVGSGVQRFRRGMRVVAANSAPCDRCYYCLRNQPNLCDNLNLLNGAYAEYIKVPAQIVKHNLYEIPDYLPFQAAALTEPLACAVHAFERLKIKEGDSVVVLGCGIMGLLFSAVAVHENARVIAIGRNERKLRLAEKIGAWQTIDVRKVLNPAQAARDFTAEQRGADFVLEAIGRPETWEEAMTMVRKGGTVCLFGGCKKGSSFSLNTHLVHYQEVSVRGVFHHTPTHFAKALKYLCEGVIDASHFIETELRLDDLSDYYQNALHKSFFKAAVIP